jgi:hypothetical protein
MNNDLVTRATHVWANVFRNYIEDYRRLDQNDVDDEQINILYEKYKRLRNSCRNSRILLFSPETDVQLRRRDIIDDLYIQCTIYLERRLQELHDANWKRRWPVLQVLIRGGLHRSKKQEAEEKELQNRLDKSANLGSVVRSHAFLRQQVFLDLRHVKECIFSYV